MTEKEPVLHMVCGKIGAGKSTHAARTSAATGAVLISEDMWLSALFADELTTGQDYLRCSAKLQKAMSPHVAGLLARGVSVVLDFPANTVAQRAWMRALVHQTGVRHEMHVLDVPDAVCLARLQARNASGDHPFAVTEAQFHAFSKHYDPPGPGEGFHVTVHRSDAD